MNQGSEKKTLFRIFLIIIVVLLVIILALSFYLILKKKDLKKEESVSQEPTLEEVMELYAAPDSAAIPQIPEEVIKSFTSPSQEGEIIPDDILQSFTAPE